MLCTALVRNTVDKSVTWSATGGTVSSSGLFTAPTVSVTTHVIVTATSRADSSKSATLALTVSPAPAADVLMVDPATLSFAGQVGSTSLASASLSITSTGTGTIAFKAASDKPWLLLSDGFGTTPDALQVSPAINGLKAGTYTGQVTMTGGGITKAVTVALALTVAPVEYAVSLSWEGATESNVISYSIYRSTSSGGSYALLASSIADVSYNDQSVHPGTVYYYVVSAVDDLGHESSLSNESRAAIP